MRPKSSYRHMNRQKAEWAREMYFTRKMKQKEIAAALNIKQGSVSRIISGMVWA